MKYFKYWVKESFEIDIDGAIEAINILSGSNISKDDARDKAEERCRVIETKGSDPNGTKLSEIR